MQARQLLRLLAILLFLLGGSGATTNINDTYMHPRTVIDNPELCETKECSEIAGFLEASMNKSADPCVDFHEFTCGSWRSGKIQKPKYEFSWDTFEQFNFLAESRLKEELESEPESKDILLIQLAKKWYKSCMDISARETTGLDSINRILQEMGGWPMIMNNNTWKKNAIPWQRIDEHYEKFGTNAFYTITLTNFFKLVKIEVPRFPFNDNIDALIPKSSVKDDLVSYRSIITSVAKIFIRMYNSSVANETLEKDIDDLVKFEEALDKAAIASNVSNETMLCTEELTKIHHLNELTVWWRNKTESNEASQQAKINWDDVVEGRFRRANFTVYKNPVIAIPRPSYLIDLMKILQSTDNQTIVNYIHWKFLSKILKQTTDGIKDVFFEITKKKYDIEEKPPHWIKCIRDMKGISNHMNDAVSYIFVKKYYSNNTHEAILEIIQNIKKSSESRFENSLWLSPEAKEAMKEKMNYLRSNIGYPEWWNNETVFMDQFDGWLVGDNYIENVLNVMALEARIKLRNYVKSLVRIRWPLSPLAVNAAYHSSDNLIVIPGVIGQPPLLGTKVPDYIRYGLVGNIIAHEIGHTFDRDGMRHRRYYMASMLDDHMWGIYNQRVECFIDMFDDYFRNYNMDPPSSNFIGNFPTATKGNLRADENIADWLDIHTVFRAYKEKKTMKLSKELKLPGFEEFTDEKMFFITWAELFCSISKPLSMEQKSSDTHSPGILRVIASVANDRDFADTFNCTRNSAMNPEHRCDLGFV